MQEVKTKKIRFRSSELFNFPTLFNVKGGNLKNSKNFIYNQYEKDANNNRF